MFEKLFFVIFLCMAAIHAAPSESLLQDKENDPVLIDELESSTDSDEIPDSDEFFYERGSHFQGDILLTPSTILGGGASAKRWSNKQIPYTIDSAITVKERNVMSAAFAHIHNKTCIRLIPRTSQQNYVRFVRNGEGCYSQVGMTGGAQEINLAPGCYTKKTVVHEIIHAVGFLHEQSRSDRDDYVTINWSNIPQKNRHNFNKRSDTISFGSPYDYESIMHYSAYAFATDKKIRTITSKTNSAPNDFGRGDGNGGMTVSDAAQINRMYGC